MKTLRHAAAILASMLGAALVARAAADTDRTGPEPSQVIYPHGDQDSSAGAAMNAGSSSSTSNAASPSPVFAPALSSGGMLPAAGYLVVLGLLVAGAWYLLKRGSLPRPFSKTEGKLRVLETRLLGNRQFLVVVEYDDAKMLLGVCQGRIDYLTPLAGHPLAAAGAIDADESETTPVFPAATIAQRR